MSEKTLDSDQQRAMRVFRANEDLSLTDLAKRIGVKVSTVRAWERGLAAPRGLYREALARVIPGLGL